MLAFKEKKALKWGSLIRETKSGSSKKCLQTADKKYCIENEET